MKNSDTKVYWCHKYVSHTVELVVIQKFRKIHGVHSALRIHLTLWKFRNFTAATVFSQKFRQIDVLLKNNYKLIWRKKFPWQRISRFSTLCAEIHSHTFLQKVREINGFDKEITK